MVFFDLFTKQKDYFITGEKCFLRPLKKPDLAKVKKWFENRDLIQHAFGLIAEDHILDKIAREYLRDIFSTSDEILAVCRNDNGMMIGFFNYCLLRLRNNKARLGIIIGEEGDRSAGIGTEAVRMGLYYLFYYRGVELVDLDTANFNERAHNCFYRCGFKKIGEMTDINFVNGELIHKYIMELKREEFYENLSVHFKKPPDVKGNVPADI